MSHKIRVGISKCLMGEAVRYDGQHKLDRYLRDTLGQYVEWVPVCPEVECGMSVPREAMRLVGEPEAPRLMTIKTKIDLTDQMQCWIAKRLAELAKENLSGFVFKRNSPSSGMQGVKIYNEKGFPYKRGSGLFAKAFMEAFPLLPVEDEGRLHDAKLRENFIERIFVYSRWQDFVQQDGSVKGLIKFHTKHKLTLMSHSPALLRKLGSLVAAVKMSSKKAILTQYKKELLACLKLIATVKKNVNVLSHIMGYFKNNLSQEEKLELMDIIEQYHQQLVPLIVPITILRHYTNKFQEPYLQEQFYLNPPPAELKLKNHV